MAWIHLNSIEELYNAIEKSEIKPQLFFKHSTRCIISKMVLQAFEQSGVHEMISVDFYLLDLLNYRNISNEIADRLNVFHQSPQAILLNKKEVVYSQTHERINGNEVKNIIDSL
jgi:bacillithiol system protein YtxJ